MPLIRRNEPQRRMLQLLQALNSADDAYCKGVPIMSDEAYDCRYRELQDLEEKHGTLDDSPTKRVCHTTSAHTKHTHPAPMLSLANAFDKPSLSRWLTRFTPETKLMVQPKFDGCALSLHYENGRLMRAVTRGNGKTGDTVSHLIDSFSNVNYHTGTPFTGEVRGEALLSYTAFNLLVERGAEYANPRNTVAGWLRRKKCPIADGTYPEDVRMEFQPYLTVLANGAKHVTYPDARLGAQHAPVDACADTGVDLEECWDAVEAMHVVCDTLDYACDGVVIKVTNTKQIAQIGDKRTEHAWALAYKFPSERGVTTLRKVDWQVGRTGRLTPRATFDAVDLSGTKVRHATLHNRTYLESLGELCIGDDIEVTKAGEIIPQVLNIAVSNNAGAHCKAPEACPVCTGSIAEQGKHLQCVNRQCAGALEARLIYFTSRDNMDIQGLGPGAIAILIECGVSQPADLYHYSCASFCDFLGDSKGEQVYASLEKSKEKQWTILLRAIGIPLVGNSAVETLGDTYKSFSLFLSAYADHAHDILGDAVFASLCTGMEAYGQRSLRLLASAGVGQDIEVRETVDTEVTGKRVCVTGTLLQHTRKEVHDMIKQMGGAISKSVSRKTDILVAGIGAGSKLERAIELDVIVWDEDRLLDEAQQAGLYYAGYEDK